ncbi:MAG: DUF4139 domain-containing protein [Bacteroidota bacterium]
MKNTFFSIAFLLLTLSSYSNDKETNTTSKINAVTVFLQGAEINCSANANITNETKYIIIEDISPSIEPNSIQVKGFGNFTITSVQHRINYLKQTFKSKKQLLIEDSLKIINKQLSQEQMMLSVYNSEKDMLMSNKSIGGNNTGVNFQELQQTINFFRNRLIEINNLVLKTNENIFKFTLRQTELNNQLKEETGNKKTSSEIVIGIISSTTLNTTFDITYFVNNCGWNPTYDIKAEGTDKPIEITYKANVYQATGYDWKNVKLSLSTGNPNLDNNKPELAPWSLYLIQHKKLRAVAYKSAESKPSAAKSSIDEAEDVNYDKMEESESLSGYVTVNESQTTSEFVIPIPYSISSSENTTSVEIQKNTLNASYQYYAAPKIDQDAFLVAEVTGWEKLSLLAGEANIYFEGSYLGKNFINPNELNDTLKLSLGRDKNIVIKRVVLKDFVSNKIIGSNRKKEYVYEINISNKKKADVSIIIEDQVPISADNAIEISTDEVSNGTLNKETGLVFWKLSVKPNETQKIKLAYSVKYPKDKQINL